MGKKKSNKVKVGNWKKAPQCCPPQCPKPCCVPQCCPPQCPKPCCVPKSNYKQDMIVIEDGCVQTYNDENDDQCYDDIDEDYHIEICSLGGNIHMSQPTAPTDDLLTNTHTIQQVEVPSHGNLLDISDNPADYEAIVQESN